MSKALRDCLLLHSHRLWSVITEHKHKRLSDAVHVATGHGLQDVMTQMIQTMPGKRGCDSSSWNLAVNPSL